MLGYCGLILFLFNFLLWIIQLCVWPRAHMNVHMPQHRCGDQRAAWEGYFSSSTTWGLGILLGSSGLAASDLPSEWAQQSSLYVFYHYPDNSFQTMWVRTAHIYWERVGFSSPGFMWSTSWCQPAGLLLETSKIHLLLSSFKLSAEWSSLWTWDQGSCDFLVVCHQLRTSYITWSVPPPPSLLVYFCCCDKTHRGEATEMQRALSWLTVLDHSPSLWRRRGGSLWLLFLWHPWSEAEREWVIALPQARTLTCKMVYPHSEWVFPLQWR